MTTKQLKVLIAVMIVLIVRILGYSQGKAGEETYVEPVSLDVTDINVGGIEEEKSEAEVLIDKVNELVGNLSISEAVVGACISHAEDYKLCIKNMIGVANAESSIFKNGMYPTNNGFGLMAKTKDGYKKRKFSSVEEAIYQRAKLYEKKNWGTRKTGQDRLDGHYCTSGCTNWIKAYDSGIKKLSID